MRLTTAIVASLLSVVVSAVPAANSQKNTCYTVHSGYIAVHPAGGNKPLTVSAKGDVLYGKPGKPLWVDFQACLNLNGNYPDEDIWTGRIVTHGKCLTVKNPTSKTQPYYVKLAKCASNTNPPISQSWRHGYGDDTGYVYWVGPASGVGYMGYMAKDDETPLVARGGVFQLGCDNTCVNL
ncbi:hypothetical protein FRB90_006349, partial [Tulasnella sp. 427]